MPVVLIALIASVIFIPLIGNCPLFDWDEVNFAECAREMIVSGDYSHVQLNFRPFWEKPPLFIWIQALSMNIFGVNEFAARFPNALCAIMTLIALFLIGTKQHSQKFGIVWCILYVTSLLPHFYFRTGIIDPFFNLFILLAVYNCHRFINNPAGNREILNALSAGFFLGLAVLTKGPAALVLLALTILSFLVWTRQMKLVRSRAMIIFIFTTILVSTSWFIIEWAKGNGKIISEFIEYQLRLAETEDSGHGGPFYYHFIVLLIGCFPSSLIFLTSYFKYRDLTPYQRNFRKILLCLFWVVLIIFSIVKTKIVHYSSICYFPLTFIAASGIVNSFADLRFVRINKFLYWITALAIGIASIGLGLFPFIKKPLLDSEIIKDEFAVQNLQANVHWSGFEILFGVLFLIGATLIYKAIERNKIRFLYAGLACNLAFIILTINVIVPKVELFTQRAAIEFYKACATNKCYVETHGFKSYAYLFYSNRRPDDYSNPQQKAFIEQQLDVMVGEGHSRIKSFAVSNQLWMEHGVIDRPAYLVIKKQAEAELLTLPELTKLYERNGFCFFVRMPFQPAK